MAKKTKKDDSAAGKAMLNLINPFGQAQAAPKTSGFVPSSGGQGTPGTTFGQAQAAPRPAAAPTSTSYNPLTSMVTTPAPKTTSTSTPASKDPVVEALAILNRQSERLNNLEQLAKAATPTPAPAPTPAPTSGFIPGFTPSVPMPTPAKQPSQSGFVGPVATSAPTPVVTPSGTSFIQNLQNTLADQYVSQGLNPDGSTKNTTQRFQDERAAAAGLTTAQAATNPMFDKSSVPSAPAGFRYTWIGGTNTGKWTLYSLPAGDVGTGSGTSGTGSGTELGTDKKLEGITDIADNKTGVPTTNVQVLKALLKSQGFAASIVDSSATYLNALLMDNIDYDNAVEIFLNTKEYTLKNGTKITSPFYTSYGYLNEGLTVPKNASELFNAVEGYKGLKEKYGFSDKYLSSESLKGYVKNNVTVADLDERANAARLAALTADPSKTSAFIKLGYISSEAGLQDFFMDSKIGKEQLDLNRNTGAFVAEAIRRNKSGVLTNEVSLSDFRKISSSLTDKGYSEAQIASLAATGFENISQRLQPMIALSGIFEKTPGTEATVSTIQSELAQEEFMNMASSRRKKLEEQNIRSFQATSGTTAGSLRAPSIGGQI